MIKQKRFNIDISQCYKKLFFYFLLTWHNKLECLSLACYRLASTDWAYPSNAPLCAPHSITHRHSPMQEKTVLGEKRSSLFLPKHQHRMKKGFDSSSPCCQVRCEKAPCLHSLCRSNWNLKIEHYWLGFQPGGPHPGGLHTGRLFTGRLHPGRLHTITLNPVGCTINVWDHNLWL
jgi:hypothetical protein